MKTLKKYLNGTEKKEFKCRGCGIRVEVTGKDRDFDVFKSELCSKCSEKS